MVCKFIKRIPGREIEEVIDVEQSLFTGNYSEGQYLRASACTLMHQTEAWTPNPLLLNFHIVFYYFWKSKQKYPVFSCSMIGGERTMGSHSYVVRIFFSSFPLINVPFIF